MTPNTGGVFAVGLKEHESEHRRGVCCWGNLTATMDVTDVKRLGGTPMGMVGACSGPSGAPSVAPVAPDRCPCTVPPDTGRGVIHLAREGLTARFLHDGCTYWKQSKRVFTGRGCERFCEEFCST